MTIQQLLPSVAEPPLLPGGSSPLLLPAASPELFTIPQEFVFHTPEVEAIAPDVSTPAIVQGLEVSVSTEPIAFLPEASQPDAVPSTPPTPPSPPAPAPLLTPTRLSSVERETIPYPWDFASDIYWQQNPTMTYPSPIGMLPGGAS